MWLARAPTPCGTDDAVYRLPPGTASTDPGVPLLGTERARASRDVPFSGLAAANTRWGGCTPRSGSAAGLGASLRIGAVLNFDPNYGPHKVTLQSNGR